MRKEEAFGDKKRRKMKIGEATRDSIGATDVKGGNNAVILGRDQHMEGLGLARRVSHR